MRHRGGVWGAHLLPRRCDVDLLALTGPPCVLYPEQCPGLAEVWPWLLAGFLILLIPLIVVVLLIRRRDR